MNALLNFAANPCDCFSPGIAGMDFAWPAAQAGTKAFPFGCFGHIEKYHLLAPWFA
jgi:hypothetical protein